MAIAIQNSPPPPPRRTTKSTAAKKTAASPDDVQKKQERIKYRQDGVIGLSQIGVFITGIFGWKADSGTLAMYGPQIGYEAATLAETNEPLGAQLDRAAELGPYAALLAIGVQFGAQIAVNHGWLKADKFGAGSTILPPEQIIAEVDTQQALEMAKRAEELAASKMEALRRLEEARARRAHAEDAMNNINIEMDTVSV
jgi:hypothetical protein